MAIAWYQVRRHFAGTTFWLIALVTQAVGAILIVLRGLVPDLISIVLANAIMQAGVIILYIGLERFTGKKGWQVHNYILLAIFISIQAYYTFTQPDLLARIINVSVATAAFSFQCFWLLMRRVDPSMRQTTRVVGIAFGCMVIFSLIRIVLLVTSPLQSNDYFKAGIPETLILISYAALAVVITFGLILMSNSRLWRELRESHQKYENLVEHLNSGVAVYKAVDDGQDFVFIDFNHAGARIDNIRREELIGKRLLEVFPGIREFGLFEVFQRVWRTGKSEHFPVAQYQDERINGWRDNYVYKLPSGEIVAIYNDVTERKQAEEKLKNSEEFLHNIIEKTPNAIWVSDENGTIIRMNQALRDLLKIKDEEIIGKYNIFKDTQVLEQGYLPLIKSVFEEGKTVSFTLDYDTAKETQVTVTETTHRLLEHVISPINDKEGRVIHAIVQEKDITEQKLLEEANQKLTASVLQEKDRLLTLVNSIPDEVWFTDTHKNITLANKMALTEFSCSPVDEINIEALAKSLEVYCADGTPRPVEEAPPLRALKGEVVRNLEEIVRTPASGELRYRQVSAAPVIDSNGHIIGSISVVRDITELKQSEEKLKKTVMGAIDTLAAMAEARDPYTAGHQLKVSMLASAIAGEMGLSPEQIEKISVAGILHDIGKVSVPSEILSKPSKLNQIEFDLIKDHPRVGANILRSMQLPWDICPIVVQHHERMDGSGYPKGLSGQDIVLEARILAVADVVEAMTSHRPYRPALGIDKALAEISKNKGNLYDPTAADVCIKLFTEKGFEFQ